MRLWLKAYALAALTAFVAISVFLGGVAAITAAGLSPEAVIAIGGAIFIVCILAVFFHGWLAGELTGSGPMRKP